MPKKDDLELSIVMPCLNEEKTVGLCVEKAKEFLNDNFVNGEVIVADNGSVDRSVEIAEAAGAHVIHIEHKGYGNALRGGFAGARGRFIIMGDADDSYDFTNLRPFVEKLREGYDLVMGNRFLGGIQPGAMPWHHRYIGNPVLSAIGRLFFHSPARDFHCGLRGFTKRAIEKMDLQTTGMELASEIVIKASLHEMKVCEVPTTLAPDGRDRPPHLRSFRDGWRHLRFLLLYSPRWLFFYPGLFLVAVGAIFSMILFFRPIPFRTGIIDYHTFIYSGTFVIIGMNMVTFSVITRVFAYNTRLFPRKPEFFGLLRYFKLETGLLTGSIILLCGFILASYLLWIRLKIGFDSYSLAATVRLTYGSSLLLISGFQIIFTSFVLSILGLKKV